MEGQPLMPLRTYGTIGGRGSRAILAFFKASYAFQIKQIAVIEHLKFA
jgi:hypothetical protein